MAAYGVNIIWTARYDYEKGKRLLPHSHSFYQVMWIAEGRGIFHYGEELSEAVPGTLYWIRPGMAHGLKPSLGTTIKTLDLKFEIISPELEAVASALPFRLFPAGVQAAELLDQIRQEGLSRQAYYKELANLHLVELIYRLARTAAGGSLTENKEAGPPPGYFALPTEGAYHAARLAERWIKEHAGEDWTVREMASQLQYSESYLRQLFKAYKGCTIPVYQKQVRLQAAKEKMAYSEAALKEVAQAVGFKTVQHFCRVFKEQEGITPGQWLKREKRGIRKSIVFTDSGGEAPV